MPVSIASINRWHCANAPSRGSAFLGVALMLVVVCAITMSSTAPAQAQSKLRRVGWLSLAHAPVAADATPNEFQQKLIKLGYAEGRDVTTVYRYADGNGDRLAKLAADLVRASVEVIVASGEAAALAAKDATRSVPIVITEMDVDPVRVRLVAALARPGANVTGIASEDLWDKRLEFMKELLPNTASLVVIANPMNPASVACVHEISSAAPARGMKIKALETRDATTLLRALGDLARSPPDGIAICADPLTISEAKSIADEARKFRIATIAPLREYVDAGALFSFGPSYTTQRREAAEYVNRILKGAKPADVPVELSQPEFVVNETTSSAIGLILPPSIRLRADAIAQ